MGDGEREDERERERMGKGGDGSPRFMRLKCFARERLGEK